ncbi:MAG: winged helix-turn-helix domain-containing protein [Vibrio ordalii]|uniref:winged helix-turn-helix domain-containing protein n=1 Tax=Vibrio ordalii TaxID=28174 RepID=UPI003F3275CF
MERNYVLGQQVIFDSLKGEIFTDEKIVGLGSRDAAILKLLCEKSNHVILKEEIHEKVWGKVLVSDTSLTKAISNLRKSLAVFEEVSCEIKTIPKEGYMLIADEPFTDALWLDTPPAFEIKNVVSSERALIDRPTLNSKMNHELSSEAINKNYSFLKENSGYLIVAMLVLIASFFTLFFMVFL